MPYNEGMNEMPDEAVKEYLLWMEARKAKSQPTPPHDPRNLDELLDKHELGAEKD